MALEVRACGLARKRRQPGKGRTENDRRAYGGGYDDLHKWYADDFQFHKNWP
jgi:hypothetical protein